MRLWRKRFDSARRVSAAAPTFSSSPAPQALFEALEPREMFYLGPMIANPTPTSALESPGDTVFRIVTNLGSIDIETFDTTAPNTVNNFRAYVNSGKIDETFFHFGSGAVLRAGAYRFTDGSGLSTPAALAPIANEFSRLNLSRTVSMFKPAGQPNGATNIFQINLQDNPSFDTTDGGYTVFGKIVAGWSVVQAIAALGRVDLNTQLGTPGGVFTAVPVTPQFNGTPTEATIVKILDIDATKPMSNGNPYINAYVFPDGLRTAHSTERIDLVNQETNFIAAYQIIIHYTTGDRDSVIATGALAPGKRFSLKTNDVNIPNYNLVRVNEGYAIEVRATRAMGVSIYRHDSNAVLGETFSMEPRFTEGALKNWNFGGGEKGALFQNSISWLGLKDVVTTVNVGIYPEVGNPKFVSFTLKPFRRGEVRIESLGALIPDGKFSIQVSATGPVMAAMTKVKLNGAGTAIDDMSATSGGINQGGTVGFIASARVPSGGESHLDMIYTAGSPAAVIVDFTFIWEDQVNGHTELLSNPVVLGGSARRTRLDLTAMGVTLPTDTDFSIRYAVRLNAAPITVTYTSKQGNDEMTTVFQNWTTRTVVFADGFYDPTVPGTQETVSIFNPYSSGAGVAFFYQVLFHFGDGTTLWWGPVAGLNAWTRVDLRPQDSVAVTGQALKVIDKINADPQFRFYSVEVITAQFTPGITGGVVAQLTRVQGSLNQSLTTTPGLDARLTVLALNHPEFG